MNRKGFSLVEMAVVLIIFGLVLASASSILTLFVNKGGAERTRKMMEANKNALFSIAASEQYPYLMDTATDDMTAGEMNAELSDLSYPKDAYGRDFLLILDSALGYTDAKDELEYSPICGTDSTTMTLRICNASGDIATVCDESSEYSEVSDVAFVLVSGSVNKNIQTDLNTSDNSVTVYYQGQDGADDHPYGVSGSQTAQQYDDIVDWVTLPELRAKAGCDPQKLRLLDSSMPVVQEGEDYNFSIYAEGGVPYADGTNEEYLFTLAEDDDFLATTVSIDVIDSDGTVASNLNADGVNGQGTHLQFSGNATPVANSVYRVIITVEDNSSGVSSGADNSITRTLYIKRQD